MDCNFAQTIPTGKNLLYTREAVRMIFNALSYYKEDNPQLVLQDKLVIDNLKNLYEISS